MKHAGSEILLSEGSNHTYIIDKPLAPIVEHEVNITYSSKEIYFLYAMEKPRLSQTPKLPTLSLNPAKSLTPKIPLHEL